MKGNPTEFSIETFLLTGAYAPQIYFYLEETAHLERSKVLSEFIELGWIASQLANSQTEVSYLEKISARWLERLSDEFKDQGLQIMEQIQKGVSTDLEDLKNFLLLDKARAVASFEVQSQTTLKGHTFEAEVANIMNQVAYSRSQKNIYVGNSPGGDGSKKGDFVYQSEDGISLIAIEAKDYSTKLSESKITELMKETIRNRQALGGIFVVKDRVCLPEWMGSFWITNDFVVCSICHLEIAIKLTLNRIERVKKTTPSKLETNYFVEGVAQDVNEIDEILKAAGACRKNASKIEDTAKWLKDSLVSRIERFYNFGGNHE